MYSIGTVVIYTTYTTLQSITLIHNLILSSYEDTIQIRGDKLIINMKTKKI